MVHFIESICDSWAKTWAKLWYDPLCPIAKMTTNQRHELNHKMLVIYTISLSTITHKVEHFPEDGTN